MYVHTREIKRNFPLQISRAPPYQEHITSKIDFQDLVTVPEINGSYEMSLHTYIHTTLVFYVYYGLPSTAVVAQLDNV